MADNINPVDPQQGNTNNSNLQSVGNASLSTGDVGRVYPRQVSTGNQRGTQIITGTLIIENGDGTQVGLGTVPDGSGDFGFFSLDKNNKVIMKIVNGTRYTYNPMDSYNNVMQDGILPDGSGGWAVANTGDNVADGFS